MTINLCENFGAPGRIIRRCAPHPSGVAGESGDRLLQQHYVAEAGEISGTLGRFALQDGESGRDRDHRGRRIELRVFAQQALREAFKNFGRDFLSAHLDPSPLEVEFFWSADDVSPQA